jgi:KaiC/GvpD/RAD55 family RecA-like ATPase
MRRVKTGITGLDKMLHGGLIAGRPYVIAGPPGSGKTILGMHFLLQGIKDGISGLYISLSEPASEIRDNINAFGWDISRVRILDVSPEGGTGVWVLPSDGLLESVRFNVANLNSLISTELTVHNVANIVIDSITALKELCERERDVRVDLLSLMNYLSENKCTSLLISESLGERVEVESFLARGTVRLQTVFLEGKRKRSILIEKMRGTGFDEQARPMRITDRGIEVFPSESLLE